MEEEHLRDEFRVYVEVLFEVQVVGYLKTNGECHLLVSASPTWVLMYSHGQYR
jgi:hypothetical protein